MAKLGKGSIDGQGSFATSSTLSQLVAYRKVIASTYVIATESDFELKLNIPLLVSTKIDGELWFLLFEKEWLLVSSTGKKISGAIEIIAAASALDKESIYAGELFLIKAGRSRVADLAVLLAQGEKAETKSLAFGIFDIVSSPTLSAIGTPYPQRFEELAKLKKTENLFVVETTATASAKEVADIFSRNVVDSGSEGLVARSQDGRTFKIKPTKEIDAAIIGFTERRGQDGTVMVRSLLFGVLKEDGHWIPISTTGNVGDNQVRTELYARLKPNVRPSSYRRTSESSGVLYQLVDPTIVVEAKCLDLQMEDSQGRAIRHPKLSLTETGWRVAGWANSAAVHNSSLIRIREDKSPNFSDVGWDQITRHLPVDESSEEIALAASEIVRRQVWTKESGEKVDVRKLVVWKTNKVAAGFPAYVVHWTDYSATRKSPLDREVRLAPNEIEAMKIAESMIAENVKKGWSERTS
jgi:hypothetical protein